MRLETERLILREWRERGSRALRRLQSPIPRSAATIHSAARRGEADADGRPDDRANSRPTATASSRSTRKSDGAFIGDVGLSPSLDAAVQAAMNSHPDRDRLASSAGPYWGQGYAPEAAPRLIAHAFGDLDAAGARRVHCCRQTSLDRGHAHEARHDAATPQARLRAHPPHVFPPMATGTRPHDHLPAFANPNALVAAAPR